MKNRRRIVIIREKEKITAVFEDKCPHNKRIKISQFFLLDPEKITCTVHGACYRLDNGIQVDGPGVDPLVIFPHRVINNRLELVID